ncbi:MAG: DUF4870 domain-containing protein [Anaerolineales bacterium]|nr:DUF4870 domain-containing protein [Anaerolineales bacterium]
MDPKPSPEERIWSALVHLSALAMGMGLILPVIAWAEQRRKSKYIAFQSLQALGYQSLGYTVWILVGLLVAVFSIFFLLLNMDDASRSEAALTGWMFAHLGLTFALLGAYFILPVIAALACALGRDFHYPIMGYRLAKYLNYVSENEGELNEAHEDRWVAAAGHFSVIIALWGLLAPVTAWILQGKRSAWLKFQSAQAIALHACALLLGFVAGILYVSGFVVFIALTGISGDAAMSSGPGLVALLIMFGLMAIALLILLLVPLFHIMGQWAGYRVLKGDDYRYPLIGGLVARWVIDGREK